MSGQEAVVVTLAAPQSVPLRVEGYAGDEDDGGFELRIEN